VNARRLLAAWGIALLWLGGVAAAAPPKLHALTEAYARQNNLPIRVVQNDLGTREIEREFVPVLPTTHQSFLEHFQTDHGAVIWRVREDDEVHVTVGLTPKRAMAHSSRDGAIGHMVHANGGRYLTLALDRAEVAHWDRFIDTYTPADGRMYSIGGLDGLFHFKTHMAQQGNPVYGGCMWWLVHAEVAPGLNLANAMGVRRARGPEILSPRLIHAGNERVGPIGIAVQSIEEFNAMTDEQLLGPEPAGGAAEQVR
jgi:hypothetical protein